MGQHDTAASDVYRLKVDRSKSLFLLGFLGFSPIKWGSGVGHAGVAIVRISDRKIVAIVDDESFDSHRSMAQLESDIETMTAFEFEQAWGVNTAR